MEQKRTRHLPALIAIVKLRVLDGRGVVLRQLSESAPTNRNAHVELKRNKN
jgi:hypothetical protein